VAKVDSIGFVGAQVDPVSRGTLVELQEHLGVVDDLGDGLGYLAP